MLSTTGHTLVFCSYTKMMAKVLLGFHFGLFMLHMCTT